MTFDPNWYTISSLVKQPVIYQTSKYINPVFIPNQITIDDIIQAQINAGLIVLREQFNFARDNNGLVYNRFSNSTIVWCYYIAFEDEDKADRYFITTVQLWLDADGLLCADFNGCPDFVDLTKADTIKKITQLSR